MLPLEKTKASRATVPTVQFKQEAGGEEPQAATQRAAVASGLQTPPLLRLHPGVPGGLTTPFPGEGNLFHQTFYLEAQCNK